MPISDSDGQHVGYFKTWRKLDIDEWAFLDFLQPLGAMEGESVNASSPNIALMAEISALVVEALSSISDGKIRKKYEWLAMYHDDIAREYPLSGVELLVPQIRDIQADDKS